MIHIFSEFCDLCHFSAIERNLESEEQERVSADMRIRKSQVNHFMLMSRVASSCFLHGTTFLMQKANNLEDSLIIFSLTSHISLDCIYFSVIPVVSTIIYGKGVYKLVLTSASFEEEEVINYAHA